MSKSRFSIRIDTWLTPELAAAIEAVADARFQTISGIMREAISLYLHQCGALPARTPPQHHAAAASMENA